jgi:tetratricopeptide (TPR) repeat protein
MNKRQRLLAILLIVFLGFVCYFNSLSNPFIWDDTALIEENFLIKDIRYLPRLFTTNLFYLKSKEGNFYRPLQSLSYMLDYYIYKLNPKGYRFTNIILQIMAAILIYEFILLISNSFIISLISASLFVVHPIHVESVAYISGRADIIMAIFLLSSLILFIRGFYLFSVIAFSFALFSKELALIFPILVLIYALIYKLKISQEKPANIRIYLLLYFLVSAIYLFMRFNLFGRRPVFSSFDSFSEGSLFFLVAPFLYLKTLFFPINLHMARTVVLPASVFEPRVIFSILGLIFLSFVIIKAYKMQGKLRIFSFSLAWFFLFLFPHLGMFSINAYFAEHFCYLSSIGIFLIMGMSFEWLIRKKKIFIFLPIILVILYSLITIKYNSAWRNEEYFYKRIIKLSKNSFGAYNNLGFFEEKRGNYKKAEEYYLKALNIKPDFEQALLNLMRVIFLSGKEEAAIVQIKDFLKKHPESFWGWANLGSMYETRGEYLKAIEAYKKSLNINPYIANHHYFLALTFQEAGDFDSAIEEFKRAISLDQKNYAYHNDLGVVYKNKGLLELALEEYLIALRLAPKSSEVSLNLGIVYSLMGKLDKAEYYLLNSIRLDSNSSLSHYNLGVFYWQKGEFIKAKEEFETALGLSPDFVQAEMWLKKIKSYLP